jgi:hypothetical protein
VTTEEKFTFKGMSAQWKYILRSAYTSILTCHQQQVLKLVHHLLILVHWDQLPCLPWYAAKRTKMTICVGNVHQTPLFKFSKIQHHNNGKGNCATSC